MLISLNGSSKEVDAGTTLLFLLQKLNLLERGGLAAAVNGQIVKRADWQNYILKEGDSLLLITAAQGG